MFVAPAWLGFGVGRLSELSSWRGDDVAPMGVIGELNDIVAPSPLS
jgi:hypothetical protein